jgi:hypothetical protein
MNRKHQRSRYWLIAQLAGVLVILAWMPTNLGKTLALAALWAVTFGRLSRYEIIIYCLVCPLAVMDILAIQNGIFVFERPDFFGMPLYEFFLWGFYIVHTNRMFPGSVPKNHPFVWILALAFSSSFLFPLPSNLLLFIASGVLILTLILFHEPLDLAFCGYLILWGALFEYTGVWSHEWSYPGNPPGGVPLWFIPMWGGIGFFCRRLMLPIAARLAHLEPREGAL